MMTWKAGLPAHVVRTLVISMTLSPAGDQSADLAVLEELPGLGELGQALGHVGDVAGVDEVGDGPSVVVGWTVSM